MSDLIRREDAREAIEKLMEIHFDRKVVLAKARDAIVLLPSAEVVHKPDYSYEADMVRRLKEAQSAEAVQGANLINRHDAITVIRDECWKCNKTINDDLFMRIMSLPTSRQTDCTEFIMWLVEVVLDDEDWELNAVAYGEVIARKLKKLGLLEVKDGYYIRHIENNTKESDLVYRPSADRPTGEWVTLERDENVYDIYGVPTWGVKYMCDKCGFITTAIQDHFGQYKFCPNCGAKMKGGEDE